MVPRIVEKRACPLLLHGMIEHAVGNAVEKCNLTATGQNDLDIHGHGAGDFLFISTERASQPRPGAGAQRNEDDPLIVWSDEPQDASCHRSNDAVHHTPAVAASAALCREGGRKRCTGHPTNCRTDGEFVQPVIIATAVAVR
jgi:hypothetical protein